MFCYAANDSQMHKALIRKAEMVHAFFPLCSTVMEQTVSPPNSYVEILTIVPQNVTVFGERDFKEIIK